MPERVYAPPDEASLLNFWNSFLVEPDVMHTSLESYLHLYPEATVTDEMRRAGVVTITKDGVFPCHEYLPEDFKEVG